MILVSACLLGVECKYNGTSNYNPDLIAYLQNKKWIPICPEQLGGLTTPRIPAEIQGGDGKDVLSGRARVVTKEGKDVTEAFIKGAKEVLKIAQLANVEEAILKERSPSCGKCQIYDGSFQGKIKPGQGVTAAILREYGIRVKTEEDLY
ncbi:hypothetical protein BBF96_10765 [Anoxybacter fermentans]|uniref:Uncharacterized protein n=1 Tax=Anoxybacter fermentans TaxID=1323375 RepID=A0A3Q9HT24_9FIRM|nr:DUF523 domain-containing protein [Anoxybacter fermentans]AZR73825.1 hypothetical protein BBF96_10765 [Anoxybacter fermentans]